MGAERLTVTPRRARCADCAATHVLLPGALSVRRADSTEAIGTALLAKAGGAGHRSIAARLHRPVSTVRRWLRGARGEHAEWLYQRGVQRAARLNRELLATRLDPFKSTLWHALNILAGLARHSREHLGVTDPPWSLICLSPRAACSPYRRHQPPEHPPGGAPPCPQHGVRMPITASVPRPARH